MEWIKVKDQLPEPGKFVIAYFKNEHGKDRRIRAMYVPRFFMDDLGDSGCDPDYDEEEDMYFWPEGWYECNEFEDTHWMVDGNVTHWMPLPEVPND